MSKTKHAPKRKRGAKAISVLGAAGLLSLAGGAAAATSASPVADLPTQKTAPSHEIILGEEELSDVSCRPSMSSTRRAPSLGLAIRSPSVDAVDAAVVAAAVVGAPVAAVAAAVGAGEVAVVAAAAVAAAFHGDVAPSAKGHATSYPEHNKKAPANLVRLAGAQLC